MKTLSGKVHSSKPISLSKAASTLSTFISTDNGASQALCAYLRRASDSFNELKQLHKELRVSRSDAEHRRSKSGDISGGGDIGDNPSRSAVSQEFNHRDDNTKKKIPSQVGKEDLNNISEGEGRSFIEEGLHRRIENGPGRSIKLEGDVVYLEKVAEAKESWRKKSKREGEVDFSKVGRHNDKNETEFRNTMANGGEFRKRRDDSEVKNSSTERRAQIVELSQEQVQGVQHNAAPDIDGKTHKKRRRSKSSFYDLEVEKDHNGGTADQERSEIEAKDKENKKNDYRVVQENMLSDSMEQPPRKKKKKEHRATENFIDGVAL